MDGTFGNIEIRAAGIDDLAPVFHLGERVFTPREVSNLYRTWDEYEVTHVFNTEPEHLLVAYAGSRMVGFAIGTMIEKQRSAWNYGHLLWLAVAPEFARQGVASMLFDRFRKLMEEKRVRMLLVDTQADNEPAIRFFTKKGFEHPIDHVYMTLNMQSQG